MTGQFSIALHILTLLSTSVDDMLSSEYIAGSVNVNPVIIRKELSNLRKHGLVSSREGKNGGYALAKPARSVTIADIFKTSKPGVLLGKARSQPNPDCPIGRQINKHIGVLNNTIEDLVVQKFGTLTLHDFMQQFK